MLLSSEFFHWTRPDLDMCLRVDMCPKSNVSSEKIHWTQTLPNSEIGKKNKRVYNTKAKKKNNLRLGVMHIEARTLV